MAQTSKSLPESYASEFAEDCAFERFIVETATPLLDPTFGPPDVVYVVDTQALDIRMLFREFVSHADFVHGAHLDLGPLLFGAAWKILDILLEHAFEKAQLSRNRPNRWDIAEKRNHALSFAGQASPISDEPQIWEPLLLAYANSVESRHALVHRRVKVDEQGAIIGHLVDKTPLLPIPKIEQIVFQRAVTRAAAAVVSGALSSMTAKKLKIELDHIPTLTSRPTSSADSVTLSPPVRVVIRATSGSRADLDEIVEKIGHVFDKSYEIDFYFEINSALVFRSEAENIPAGLHDFELGAIPEWAESLSTTDSN